MAFAPDGRRLVSGSGDGTVRIWETDPVRTRARARRERAAIRERVEPRVRAWLEELGDAERALDAIAAEPDLAEVEKKVARQKVLAVGLE